MGLKERRQREKEARREQILKAARELLYKKGISGTSMNQIANRAELGVATLYSYFKSKEELFLAIGEEGLKLLRVKTVKVLESETDLKEKLRKVAIAYLDFSNDSKHFFYIINYFVSMPEVLFTPKSKNRIDQFAKETIEIVEGILSEGIKQAVFRPVEIERCAMMYWGMFHGLTQLKKFQSTLLKNDSHRDFYSYSVEQYIEMICI